MGRDLRMHMSTTPEPPDPREADGSEIHEDESAYGPSHEPVIPRADTLIRIGLTLLFLLVIGVVETVLAVIVIFELIAALVTQEPPSGRVRDFANRIITYYYRIGRYLTYNESRIPFPFDEFPEPLEGDAFDSEDSEARAMGVSDPSERAE